MADTERHKPKESTPDIEWRPDGRERFEQAVAAAIKSGPKLRNDEIHQSLRGVSP